MDFLLPTRGAAFHVMAKPMGAICNLNCSYCYYLEKNNLYAGGKDSGMPDEVLETFIQQYIQIQKVPVVSFVWQGGEPTLAGLDFYRKVVQFQKKHAGEKRIENSLQTNGTRLNDEWCEFLAAHHFLVGISVDGPANLHNTYRQDMGGHSTFDRVMEGIRLLQKYKVEFNTLTTVNAETVQHPLEIYRFLKRIGSGFIQFLPVVERKAKFPADGISLVDHTYEGEAQLTPWSVTPEDYGKFLIAIFDEWIRNDVGRFYVQLFDVTLANWVGQMPGLCVFSETCGDALVIEKYGDVYSCDHFVYPQYHLGNVLYQSLGEMVTDKKQEKFGLDKRSTLPQFCLDCEYRFACHGECPKHRFVKTPSGESGLNYLCKAYKMFFSHVHPYMQYMDHQLEKKQAPANVMAWIRQAEARKQSKKNILSQLGRNDPCWCGSGKKFKNCCMANLAQ